ncbi:MAG: LysR family transcriptional regulator [Rhizobiales bacterium]|nr:LysR family transcriptional regulator [Hyphomicrobiales bacterium]MBO6699402.1 LysR family transcriptional regulator [Hyphomicrobiales bacterium]MBO6736940.1 LysR family transcriptional regulator [Hyphomicrobiales bacterium]MBO6911986.1 LysR family transcriptional regulator [Hyphomicrobiales bacterium]MBO6954646.1 LysR family transcriptional regulator [Hyphomicrobiales bacterium]
MNWDDLAAFLMVARHGGLSGAARALKTSPATLGRRIDRLEQALGVRLFSRSGKGYTVTDDGEALIDKAEAMEKAALGVDRWRAGLTEAQTVRLSAGSWTSRFFAEHIDALVGPNDPFRLAFVSGEARLDIARREADIGLRNGRPVESGLAGKALGEVAFAAYRALGATPDVWIQSAANTPSARWVASHHGAHIALEANTPRLVMDLCEAGVGLAVLPCFIGDANPRLERATATIEALTHRQWLVMHHETRHQRPIRTVLRRLESLLQANRDLFGWGKVRPAD